MLGQIKSRKTELALDYLGISVGIALTAFALDAFLIPNKIAAGGVSGLATVIFHLSGFPVGLAMLLINLPLFFASVRVLGPRFGVRTLFGAVVLSLMVDLMARHVAPLTKDALLASIYGGALAGAGMGLAFRYGGSTAGTDMAAQLLTRFVKTSVGKALLGIDFTIIAAAGVVFGAELALYALLSLFITSRVIDLVQEGSTYAKAAYVISDQPERIAEAILTKMERGATGIKGRGMFTGREREILLVIVTRAEIARLKELVASIDPSAFVVISDVHEVLGEGFKR